MNTELKDKWIEMVSDEELNITAEWLYTLLNPTDKKEFFKIVGVIVERHMPKDDENGYTISNGNQTWTTSYRTQFKMTAVNYLIEFEKENNTNLPGTNIITYPYPLAGDPVPTTDPYKPWWQQIYCQNNTGYKYNGTGHVTTTYTV